MLRKVYDCFMRILVRIAALAAPWAQSYCRVDHGVDAESQPLRQSWYLLSP